MFDKQTYMREWRRNNKEKQREYNKKYRSKPETKIKKKEYSKKYNQRPEVKERRKTYENSSKRKEYHRKWIKEYMRELREKFPEKYKERMKKDLQNKQKKRHKLKEELVKIMGGVCRKCGYNKYMGALEFAHIKKINKEEELARLIVKLDKKNAIEEIKKCILLCNRCHREYDANLWYMSL